MAEVGEQTEIRETKTKLELEREKIEKGNHETKKEAKERG